MKSVVENYSLIPFVVAIFITATGFSQNGIECTQNSEHPYYHSIVQVIDGNSIVREYILHIPINYDENVPTPLIIAMHGFGDCAADFANLLEDIYSLDSLADSEDFIVAYPQAAYRAEKEDFYWEPGDNQEENIYSNDVYFVDQLIVDIGESLNLDFDQIYASGYSNGGMMAYSLACNRDVFSAIGIMSGVMLPEVCNNQDPIPIIKFHGIEDEVLPYYGNQWYDSVSEVVEFWQNHNEIPEGNHTTQELNDGKVIHDSYYGGAENSCISLYTIIEEWEKPGGHVWFSQAIDGRSPNKIMWDFFSEGCSSVTSFSEIKNARADFLSFPNPAGDELTLVNLSEAALQFRLYDYLGNLVLSGRMDSDVYTLNLMGLVPNVYILQTENQQEKIMKSN